MLLPNDNIALIRHFIVLLALLLFLHVPLYSAFPQPADDEYGSLEKSGFTVLFIYGQEGIARHILKLSTTAKHLAEKETGLSAPSEVSIIFCRDHKEFTQKTQYKNENIYACAVGKKNRIYVNGGAFQMNPSDRILGKVLTHEIAHLLFARNIPEKMPLWLEEGLAMHVAHEMRFGDRLKLAYAKVFNRIIKLRELDLGFPQDEKRMALAYAESYSVVECILQTNHISLKAFIKGLTRRDEHGSVVSRYWLSYIRENIEMKWRAWLGSHWKNIILIIIGPTMFWFAISLLFIIAYVKKRKQQKALLEQWENEEDMW